MKNNNPFTVYISGKISDLPQDVYKANFKTAELECKAKDWKTFNPAETEILDYDVYTPMQLWIECMLIDIREIMENCDGIYMLNNWRRSRGARIERIIAQELGLFIAYQPK